MALPAMVKHRGADNANASHTSNRRLPLLNELSLFSGAGGGLLGTKLLGFKAIGYVENNPYCQEVLKQRIADRILDAAPIFGDIRKFISDGYATAYTGMVDVITGGFPCQPFSVAGKGLGEADPRNMWPETFRCLSIIRPRFALLENVPGLASKPYLGKILGQISEIGYDCQWNIMGASDVGAPHQRKRLWIMAYARGFVRSYQFPFTKNNGYSNWWRNGQKEWGTNRVKPEMGTKALSRLGEEWKNGNSEPPICRVVNGVPNQLDRLKAIGNGQVPLCVAVAFQLLAGGKL